MDRLTEWYPPHIKPVRIGVYENQYNGIILKYSYWNGSEWANSAMTIDEAFCLGAETDGAIQEKTWRGLARKPK